MDVPALEFREMSATTPGEMSDAMRERVVAARTAQAGRYEGERIFSNARQKSLDRQLTADDARTRLKRF